jgi:hypothetical protein
MMIELISGIILAVLISISLVAFFIVLNVFFPGRISRARQAAQNSPGRCLLLGVVNLTFFGAISLAFFALSSWLGEVPFLQVIGLIFLIIPSLAVVFGLAGLVEMVGERLVPDKSAMMRTTWGALALTLACALPFVGWFALLPYLALLGLGAFIFSLTNRREPPADFDPALGEMPVSSENA